MTVVLVVTCGCSPAPLSLVPVDRLLDVVEGMVKGLTARPSAAGGKGALLVSMALQHLARLQAAQPVGLS